ncbi:MAG: hypothetical protein MZV70_00785 [Desulfobacterales bacterium]|nr:hypothetical protein [Desulfobacterales bacterium]
MTMAIVNEWLGCTAVGEARNFDQAGSVAAHELGHELGLKTHYGDIRWSPGLTRDVVTPWDIMGLSPGTNHFIGWAEVRTGMDTGMDRRGHPSDRDGRAPRREPTSTGR